MSSRPRETLWAAEPHTVAKIKIVAEYVQRWATVLGQSPSYRSQPLTYIDGFAGPGEYTNSPEGSPVAAIRALVKARSELEGKWQAGVIRTAFIEADRNRAEHLTKLLEEEPLCQGVDVGAPIRSTFVEGLEVIERLYGLAFLTREPLLAFVDPFGATGVPFSAIARILASPTSELILNFDADGVARIFAAGHASNHKSHLDSLFGCDEWRTVMKKDMSHRELSRAALRLYTALLKKLPSVRFVFSFEMSNTVDSLDYFLIFASQHPVGLIKMKEVMRKIDQTGAFQFRDAAVGQGQLIRYDHPEDWLPKLCAHFSGREVKLSEIEEFVLLETPLVNFKKDLLSPAEQMGRISVVADASRKRNTFPDDKVRYIVFSEVEDA